MNRPETVPSEDEFVAQFVSNAVFCGIMDASAPDDCRWRRLLQGECLGTNM